MFSLLLLVACSGDPKPADDTADSGTDTAETGETADTHTCNTANEDCGPGECGGEGINMLPGADCLACHTQGGDREAPPWTAGGTVFSDEWGTSGAGGAVVRITDSTGHTETLTAGSSGNFYTRATLVPPLTAEVETDAGVVAMAGEVSTGACNSCHRCDGEAGGKLYAP